MALFICFAAVLVGFLTSQAWAAAEHRQSDMTVRNWALEKRGVGLTGPEEPQQILKIKGVSWAYDWTLGENQAFVKACAAQGVEYMPMIWSVEHLLNTTGSRIVDVYQSNQTFPKNSKYLLGFNEPNKLGQAQLSAEMAADNWPLMEKAAKHFNLKLVAPVPATCGDNDCILKDREKDPFEWWDNFFANCTATLNRTCHVDVMALHFYHPCELASLERIINEMTVKYNKPIVITEFGCWEGAQGSVQRTVRFMRKATSFLDGDPRVLRYAWWSPTDKYEEATGPNALYYGSGEQTRLTGLGKIYLEKLCPANASSAKEL